MSSTTSDKDYAERSQKYLDGLDFKKLEEIKSKELKDINDGDLVALGFYRIKDDEIENLFCFADLDGLKVYIRRKEDKVELLGHKLKKLKEIYTTSELLDETLTKWRLKM